VGAIVALVSLVFVPCYIYWLYKKVNEKEKNKKFEEELGEIVED
jgi:hypothetical protein